MTLDLCIAGKVDDVALDLCIVVPYAPLTGPYELLTDGPVNDTKVPLEPYLPVPCEPITYDGLCCCGAVDASLI